MTENDSVNKEILCRLEVFNQFRTMFEMLSDTYSNESTKSINPRIFLVQDTHGSEFIEFFQKEMLNKYNVHEYIENKHLDEILQLIEPPLNSEDRKDNEEEQEETPVKSSQRTIIFINNPKFREIKDKKKIIDLIQKIAPRIKDSQEYFCILRIISENFPKELMEYVDFKFTIPFPTRIQRIETFEKLFEELGIHTVDITHLADLTEEYWNIEDLKRLVNAGYVQWKLLNYNDFKSNLENQNEMDDEDQLLINKIPLTVEIFLELINNDQIQPIGSYNPYEIAEIANTQVNPDSKITNLEQKAKSPIIQTSLSLEGLGLTELNSFTSSQLYQYAAANRFEELSLIIEKIDQGKKLDEIDRKILANYAFILKDPPNRALLKLTNAKKTIDRIQKLTER